MRSLFAALERARALAGRGDDDLYRTAPAVSAWSVAQHLDHAARVTRGCLATARRIRAGKGEPGGGPNLRGRLVLLLGRIPRGRGRAPEAFVPQERPAREAVLEAIEDAAAAARGLEGDSLVGSGTVAHHHFGPMRARHWVRFAAVHLRHHLALIDDILSA